MLMQRGVAMLVILLFPASAWAYVDPGSGMLILQGVLAALGAVIMFARKPMEALKRLFRRFRRKP